MNLPELRDLIIVIVGIEIIILTIAVGILGFVLFRKIKKTVDKVKRATRPIQKFVELVQSIRETSQRTQPKAK